MSFLSAGKPSAPTVARIYTAVLTALFMSLAVITIAVNLRRKE